MAYVREASVAQFRLSIKTPIFAPKTEDPKAPKIKDGRKEGARSGVSLGRKAGHQARAAASTVGNKLPYN